MAETPETKAQEFARLVYDYDDNPETEHFGDAYKAIGEFANDNRVLVREALLFFEKAGDGRMYEVAARIEKLEATLRDIADLSDIVSAARIRDMALSPLQRA